MKNSYIKDFIALAKIGNFLEAADALYISQSTLSRHIKSLEKELGVQLFDRTTRKVVLSEAGKIFLPYATKIAKLQDDYQKELKNLMNKNHYSITLGSIPVLTTYHITDIFIKFQKQNPNFSLNILEGDTNELINMVINKKCDFAFIRVSDKRILQDFNHVSFAKDRLAAFIPKSHPLSSKATSIQLKQLKDEKFLLLKSNTMMYKLCLDVCESAGFTPDVIYTGSRSSNIIDLVKKGMGITLLMKNAATTQDTLKDLCVLNIEPEINTTIYLIYNKSHKMNIASEYFINLIKENSLNTI